jgi:hypothetical protein
MRTLLARVQDKFRGLWAGLRQWSGDAAYERYVECSVRHGARKTLSESEFYLEQLHRRYSRPNRCC